MFSNDFEFRKQIMDFHIGSDAIKYCYQCSNCTDNCPIATVKSEFYTNPFDPRLVVMATLLGYKTAAVELGLPTIWNCQVCDTCDVVCPQNIEVTEILTLAKNISASLGNAPDHINAQAKAILENGKAIPSQPAIERRREQMGLPTVAAPDVNEIATLLKNIGVDKKIK
jgi:heterodisulfide reductase subunit C